MVRRFSRCESGQAAVEMALLLPVLLLFVVGIIEFGRAYHVKHVVTDAAREGARRAVVQDPRITQDSVDAAIRTAVSRAGYASGDITLSFDRNSPPAGHWREKGSMQTVTVSVPYRFKFFGALLKLSTGSETITVRSVLTMRNE